MFVDACAIVSMVTQEPTARAYEEALDGAPSAFTSAFAAWEAIVVLAQPGQFDCPYSKAETVVVEWLEARNIELREADSARTLLGHAVSIAEKHGIGRRHLSNFDCFHYAHAKAAGEPLLTLDQKLRKTDVVSLPR